MAGSSSRGRTTNCWQNAASTPLSMETGPQTWPNTRMALDKETEERIEQPVSEEAERETRLNPAEAVKQMKINDHSWVHIQIVANIALKLLRQLTKHHIEPSVVRDYGYENDDAEVVVLLGALTHCIGMSVHREGHEDFSLFLAEPK